MFNWIRRWLWPVSGQIDATSLLFALKDSGYRSKYEWTPYGLRMRWSPTRAIPGKA